MAKPYPPSGPDTEQVALTLVDSNLTLRRWSSYTFNSHFLNPTDAFHFDIGEDQLADDVRDALVPGAHVRLTLAGNVQGDGYIDAVSISRDRGGGTVYSIEGRDGMGQIVDAIADPTIIFKEGATLADVLKQLFTPFGFDSDDKFIIDASASRDAKTGGLRGGKYSKGKKTAGRELKSYVIHQLKPYHHEGVWHFASRVAQRFGLWIWLSADGETVICAKPEYDQEPTYQIVRDDKGNTNVEAGSVRYDVADQPAVIIADGFSGGGEFGKGHIKAYAINPYGGLLADGSIHPTVKELLAQHPDAVQVGFPLDQPHRKFTAAKVRPAFMHDDESKTQDQIENFVRREMSLLARKSVTCHYTVTGHGQLVNDILVPWETDTLVDVQDDLAGLNEHMYVLARTFNKSRGGRGTTTELELIRLNSIIF